jgi:hypothetical protein
MVLEYIRHLQMWLVYDWLQPCDNLPYLLERLVALQTMHSYGSVHIIKYSQYKLYSTPPKKNFDNCEELYLWALSTYDLWRLNKCAVFVHW